MESLLVILALAYRWPSRPMEVVLSVGLLSMMITVRIRDMRRSLSMMDPIGIRSSEKTLIERQREINLAGRWLSQRTEVVLSLVLLAMMVTVRILDMHGSLSLMDPTGISSDPTLTERRVIDLAITNRVIIGAPGNDGNGGIDLGHAQVFEYDGSNWNKLGSDIDGEAAYDKSGKSMAIKADGSHVIIGASGNTDNGSGSGHARVFEYDGSDWNKLGSDIDGEASVFFLASLSVAITADGSRVIIGAAPSNVGNGVNAGHARVFEYDGSDWNKLGSDIDGEATDSADEVAISADRNLIVIGAISSDGNGANSGSIRLYKAEVRRLQCSSFLSL
jgi:hypothetical protein